MKKLLKALTLAVLCVAVMSVAALAAENITANDDGTFPAAYADGTNGEYYALVVVKGVYTEEDTPTISENTVLHIDQVTADANGATFESFTPKTNDAATVYIGGSDLGDGPVILGYINAELEQEKTAKIPVNAGDVIYKAGADIAPVVIDVAGTYDIVVDADTEGTYIVNTGYAAQKVYTVDSDLENCFEEVTEYENGILGKPGVSVRYVDPQGVRFKGEIKDTIRERDDLVEYGFIMTAESTYNALPAGYVLDMALVETGKAKSGVAYDKGTTDLYAEKTADSTIIAGVLYGIPKNAASVKTQIASRPYYKLEDGSYVYGEITKASIYQVAKAIYNVEGYEAAWEYAKEIIELVDGPMPVEQENEIAIDISSLYN